MKKQLGLFYSVVAIIFGAIFLSINQPVKYTGAATLTKGVTFTTNQLVQYYDLNNLVDNATLSDIVSGDITDGTIAAVDLGANSVTTSKILDATILTGDIGSRTLLAGNMATNSITGVELHTNITTRAGIWDLTLSQFVANSITNTAILAVSSGGAAGDAGKIPELDAGGKVDKTMIEAGDILIYQDQKANTTVGGAASAGAYTKHTLTTEVVDTGSLGSVSSSVINLAAGTYRTKASARFYACNSCRIKLRDTTGAADLVLGESADANSNNVAAVATLEGRFTIASASNIELQYFVETNTGTSDLGIPVSSGDVEIYATVVFEKE